MVIGPKTNLAFLRALMRSPEVAGGAFDTGFIDAHLARLGASPHPPDQRAVLAAARLLLARRDASRPSRLDPSIPGASRTRSNSWARAGSGSTC